MNCLQKIFRLIISVQSSSIVQYRCLKAVATSTKMADSFNAKSDIYKGVTINTENLTFTDAEFEQNLNSALLTWIKSGVRGIWFRVHIKDSSFIPILVKNGFVFHHAKQSYAMLTRWLPEDELNLLPLYPHTHIGVGGLVVNEKNEILVIQERFQQKPHWKLPGGYSVIGEEFSATAQREVLEETGIDTEFISVISLRHHHKHLFDCSDIYIVCHLRPKSETVTRSQEEIALCQWMDIDIYRTHPDVTEFNKFVINAFLQSQALGITIVPSQVLFFTKESYNTVYSVKQSEESSLTKDEK